MQISHDQAKAIFLYFADVAATYKIIYETLQTGVGFTPESIQAEIDFNTAMLEALGAAFRTQYPVQRDSGMKRLADETSRKVDLMMGKPQF